MLFAAASLEGLLLSFAISIANVRIKFPAKYKRSLCFQRPRRRVRLTASAKYDRHSYPQMLKMPVITYFAGIMGAAQAIVGVFFISHARAFLEPIREYLRQQPETRNITPSDESRVREGGTLTQLQRQRNRVGQLVLWVSVAGVLMILNSLFFLFMALASGLPSIVSSNYYKIVFISFHFIS